MELIKKIIVCIFILIGVALLGFVACAGVLVLNPNIRIFGFKFINTAGKDDVSEFLDITSINILSTTSVDLMPTIFIDSNNFNTNILPSNSEQIKVYMTRKIVGYTNSLDSNIEPKFTTSYNDNEKTYNIKVSEPSGLFFKRDAVLTVEVPQRIVVNVNGAETTTEFNVITKSNDGLTTFGNEEKKVTINNLTSSCTSAKGSIKFNNIDVLNDLSLKNILGRVSLNKNITGSVVIDSRIGTYEFNKINNLEVKASSTDGITNNPSITVKEVNNIKYRAESGLLKVTDIVNGSIDVETRAGALNINETVGEIAIIGESGNVTINKLGIIDNVNSNIKHTIALTDGDIAVERSYDALSLKTTKGMITAKQCYKEVCAISTYGSINIEFYDGVSNDGISNTFIKEYLTNYTPTTANPSLKVITEQGSVNVKNIRNNIQIDSTNSQITLHFLKVHLNNVVNTYGKQVKVEVDSSAEFITKVRRINSSNANFTVNFGNIELNNWPTETDVNENIIVAEETIESVIYKTATILLNSATQASTNVLQINSNNGIVNISKVE